ncbi:WD40-repeat-containing domain protein [Aspergillus granulosus]|uniref:WD40-repeat-containing domain protein n=1 Tax=Aspergillus granulosus TaxID=176169 RepID=A0ABR4HYY7_9EURO
MHTLKELASSSLSLAEDNYIYSIVPSSQTEFAAISSDDSLRIFDANKLSHASLVAKNAHDGVTSLRTYDASKQLVITGGRDGKIKLWDLRNGKNTAVGAVQTCKLIRVFFPSSKHCLRSISSNGGAGPSNVSSLAVLCGQSTDSTLPSANQSPVLSIACCSETNNIVAGTELFSHQAIVAFWDVRSPNQPHLQYVESHNDDVTELQYHPTRHHILLSGSTDGLVNIYDTTVTDEDEALVQVINHGSVHHAGFINEKTIFALSHDEDFSIHPATNPDDPTQEPDPVQFGDLRQPLACEYIAQLCIGSQAPYIAAGNKLDKRLDLIPLVPTPSWRFDEQNLWRLPGGHGGEVVRSVYVDEQVRLPQLDLS